MAQLVGGTILGKDGVKTVVLEAGTNDYTIAWDAPAAARQLNIADPLGNDTFVFLAATQTLTNKTLTSPVINTTLQIQSAGELRLMDADNSHYVAHKAPATVTTSPTYTWPAAPTATNFLQTDANGVMSWVAGGTAAYSVIQEEGTGLTARTTLNFIGAAITAADNVPSTRTDVTLSQSPTNSTSVVGTGRTLTAGGGLTGTGDLSADRTFAVGAGTGITVNTDDVAVDQAFTPTWTGAHTFAAGPILTISGADPADGLHKDSVSLTLRGKYNPTGAPAVTNKDATLLHNITDSEVGTSQVELLVGSNTFVFKDDGSLTVPGGTTTISSTTMTVVDKNITVNQSGNDAASEGAGVTVARTGTAGSFIYKDASATKFALGALASEVDVVGISSTQTLTNKTIAGGSNTITGLLHGTQVDNPSSGVHGVVGSVVGTTDTQTLTNKTISTGSSLGAAFNAASNDITGLAAMTQANGLTGWTATTAGKALTLGKLGTANGTTQGYDSQMVEWTGSGWTGTAEEAVIFRAASNVASQSSAKLLIQKRVGTASAVNLMSLDLSGNLAIIGTITEAATITEL